MSGEVVIITDLIATYVAIDAEGCSRLILMHCVFHDNNETTVWNECSKMLEILI